MSALTCPDCDRVYQSLKAAMLCQCEQLDEHGYKRWTKGTDWLP